MGSRSAGTPAGCFLVIIVVVSVRVAGIFSGAVVVVVAAAAALIPAAAAPAVIHAFIACMLDGLHVPFHRPRLDVLANH